MRREFQQHLLIDGYNVLHHWVPYRPLLKRSIVAAAERLVEEVRPIHDMDNARVTVVFDGQGTQVQIERPSAEMTFSVLYAPADVTADGLIEQIVARAADPRQCTVVTRDNLIGESIRASGAVLMTVDWLFDWVERCQSRLSAEVLSRHRTQKSTWKENTSPWDSLSGLQMPPKRVKAPKKKAVPSGSAPVADVPGSSSPSNKQSIAPAPAKKMQGKKTGR